MSEAHEERHARLEREAADMERRSDELGEEIEDAKRNWEAQKGDEGVPGAQSPEGGLPPEANYTTRGDEPPDDGGDRGDRGPWPDE